MRVFVGLGNPEEKYNNTYHNLGFLFVDEAASRFGLSWSLNKKLEAYIAKNSDYIFVKPQTFMNLSGKSVTKVLKFYDLDASSLVLVHDDLDLEQNSHKIQFGRGPAGHNGVKSVQEILKTQEFTRIRIGVKRPAELSSSTTSYVLSKAADSVISYTKDLARSLALNNL